MSRIAFFVTVLFGLLSGALAWALADADEWRIAYGALPVVGSGVLLMTFARLRERDPSAAHGGALRVLLHFAVIGWIVHIALFSPFEPARAFLTLHIAIAAGAGFLLWRLRGDSSRPPLPLIAEILLAGLWIMLAGAEVTLRVFATLDPRPLFLQRDMSPDARLACVRLRPTVKAEGATVNADGFRGPPFEHQEGKRTILVIGDRNLTHGVATDATALAVAQRSSTDLVFWDATLLAVGTAEFAALLDEMLPRTRPDAVLVVVAPDDDFFDLERIGPSWRWLAMGMDRENVLLARIGEMFAARFRGEALSLTGDAGTRAIRLVDAVRGRLGESLALRMVESSTALAARARSMSIPLGIVLMPAPHMVDGPRLDALLDVRPGAERDAPIVDLQSRLVAHEIAVIDLTDILRTATRASGNPAFVADDVTLNAEGSHLAGIAIAEFARKVLSSAGKRDR
ncbi:MAG: hypothetical protein AB7I19_07485 [Planctomycetota bacterium]